MLLCHLGALFIYLSTGGLNVFYGAFLVYDFGIPCRASLCIALSGDFVTLMVQCVPRVLTRKDARLLRDMRITAYFRQCFPSSSNITKIKELAHALASHPPYEVPVSAIKIKHLHCQVSS